MFCAFLCFSLPAVRVKRFAAVLSCPMVLMRSHVCERRECCAVDRVQVRKAANTLGRKRHAQHTRVPARARGALAACSNQIIETEGARRARAARRPPDGKRRDQYPGDHRTQPAGCCCCCSRGLFRPTHCCSEPAPARCARRCAVTAVAAAVHGSTAGAQVPSQDVRLGQARRRVARRAHRGRWAR